MIDKIWKTNNFVSSALLPLSFLYFLIIQIYKIIKYEKKCDVPVICVGNLTLGGAGKTPTVIKIREILSDYFEDIYVLIRGYRGEKKFRVIDNIANRWRLFSIPENLNFAYLNCHIFYEFC